MRSLFFITVLGLCVFLGTGSVFARTLGIVSPSDAAPFVVKAGAQFSVQIAIPFALTPPPGVQKASVWRAWSVFLEREADVVMGTKYATVRYETRLLTIRPGPSNVNYVIVVEAQQWLPSGRYDLRVAGSGFSYSAPGAVIINKPSRSRSAVKITSLTANEWRIENGGTSKWRGELDFVIGKAVPGAKLSLNGKPVSPKKVCFAGHQTPGGDDGRRLLRVPVSVGAKAHVTLRAEKTSKSSHRVSISLEGKQVRPLQWVRLSADTSFAPKDVIWDFADGENAVGAEITYRWMVTTEAQARVAAFEPSGAVHRANMKRPLLMPLARQPMDLGCTVNAVGTQPSVLYIFLFNTLSDTLINTCFESFLLLME